MSVSTPDVVDIPEITRNTRFVDLPELVDPPDAATLLGLSLATVYESMRSSRPDKIPCVKVGRKRQFVPKSYFLDLLKTA
jgi:predicted DNA-binding transcriptional regulator AlpA